MSNNETDWTAVRFTKSSYSGSDQGNCVELGIAANLVGIRDSKLGTTGPVLEFPGAGFRTFLAAAQAGRFDRTQRG